MFLGMRLQLKEHLVINCNIKQFPTKTHKYKKKINCIKTTKKSKRQTHVDDKILMHKFPTFGDKIEMSF